MVTRTIFNSSRYHVLRNLYVFDGNAGGYYPL